MFTAITVTDIIDILIVAGILYGTFRLLRKSGAVNLFWGIMAFVLVWLVARYVFRLELTGAILDQIVNVGAIALIVIFQNEIRGFFYRIGARFSHGRRLFFRHTTQQQEQLEREMNQIVMACRHMSQSHTGALIILTHYQDLKEWSDTGEEVDAAVSARMIEQIFYKNTPLHDGALFITNGRLESAACILPVSQNPNLPTHYGLRHRAALGLTEKTDATAVVVSEETGTISIAQGDRMNPVREEDLLSKLVACYH